MTTQAISGNTGERKPTPIEYVLKQRDRFDRKEIDIHEYGWHLREVKPFLSYIDIEFLEAIRKSKRGRA